jgi:antitoxin component YwqK of YwqJK toxin-antitoxin module
MKMRLFLFVVIFGIALGAKAQKVITILPNGEIKSYSKEELKENKDISTDGYRVEYSDSGVVMEEVYIKAGEREGSRKVYNNNGILVTLAFYEGGTPSGTWFFWDDKGILKSSATYKCGKVETRKEYK